MIYNQTSRVSDPKVLIQHSSLPLSPVSNLLTVIWRYSSHPANWDDNESQHHEDCCCCWKEDSGAFFCLRPGSLGIGCFMTKGKVSPAENVQWSKACPVPGRGTLMELACT